MFPLEIRPEFARAHPDLVEKLNDGDAYDFLDNFKDNLLFLVLSGSYAYGTNVEQSDLDIRGVAFEKDFNKVLLGKVFEQVIDRKTDTVIYEIGKFLKLLTACNPNIVELMGARNEDYLYISPLGEELLENADKFLSKKLANAFCGYAYAQLARIENATARDTLPELKKKEHILASINNALMNIQNYHKEVDGRSSIKVYIDKNDFPEEKEKYRIYMSGSFDRMPLTKYTDIYNTMKAVCSDYDKIGARNDKKDAYHLNKHAMHLVRLLSMGRETLKTGRIKTYRDGEEHELLMKIRDGYFYENGLFKDEFYNLVKKLREEFKEAEKSSALPDRPDSDLTENFLVKVRLLGGKSSICPLSAARK